MIYKSTMLAALILVIRADARSLTDGVRRRLTCHPGLGLTLVDHSSRSADAKDGNIWKRRETNVEGRGKEVKWYAHDNTWCCNVCLGQYKDAHILENNKIAEIETKDGFYEDIGCLGECGCCLATMGMCVSRKVRAITSAALAAVFGAVTICASFVAIPSWHAHLNKFGKEVPNQCDDNQMIQLYKTLIGDNRTEDAITFRVKTNGEEHVEELQQTIANLIVDEENVESWGEIVKTKKIQNGETVFEVKKSDIKEEAWERLGVDDDLRKETGDTYQQFLWTNSEEEQEKLDELELDWNTITNEEETYILKNGQGEAVDIPTSEELINEELNKDDSIAQSANSDGEGLEATADLSAIHDCDWYADHKIDESELKAANEFLANTEGFENYKFVETPDYEGLTKLFDEIKYDPAIENCHREIDNLWVSAFIGTCFLLFSLFAMLCCRDGWKLRKADAGCWCTECRMKEGQV